MERVQPQIDPYARDDGRLGVSLVSLSEIVLPCLQAADVGSVAEVGAYAGDLTELLLDAGFRVTAIDPSPQDELEALVDGRPDLELLRMTSLEALDRIELPDAVILDGDHNHYTVSEELRRIRERAGGGPAAAAAAARRVLAARAARRLLRAQLIPADHRQPTVEWSGIHPDEAGLTRKGMPYQWPAALEGGPRNGVLTAVEDFLAQYPGLRLAVVPAFFGLGVVWDSSAPWNDSLADLLEPLDRNPLLARLEANRVRHLAEARFLVVRSEFEAEREGRVDDLLTKLLGSRIFALAERLSRLRKGGRPAFSKDELRRALSS